MVKLKIKHINLTTLLTRTEREISQFWQDSIEEKNLSICPYFQQKSVQKNDEDIAEQRNTNWGTLFMRQT